VSCWIPRILILPFFCAVAVAQTPDPGKTFKLLVVHVKGLQHLSESQVIAATGLKAGQVAGEQEFKLAAQKLAETGVFTELTYSYEYSPAGCNLEFRVAEDNNQVPIIFENFVWFSDDQLLNLLRTRVSLFDGKVPTGGNLTERLAHALTSILNERNIPGEVEYLPFAPENEPIQAYDYKVKFHPVLVRNMEFPGATPEDLPLLLAAAKQLAGQEYVRTNLRAQERLNLLPVYHSRGYLKAEFAEAQAKVANDGAQTLVDVSFPVTRGIQYKLSDLQFAGNTAFPAGKLRDLVHLKPGEPANSVQLAEDIRQIQKLYGTKGYLFAHVEPVPNMDDSKAMVAYQLNVVENDLYHMGDLSIDGIPAENASRMVAQWQMKKGDPFDSSYLQRFFSILYRDFGLRKSYDVDPKQAINQQEKTVSVSLHFVPRS